MGISNKQLFSNAEKLLMDSRYRIVASANVHTYGEVRCEHIHLAMKNVKEVEKKLVVLMTKRGVLGEDQCHRFISTQRLFAEVKVEVRDWHAKVFGNKAENDVSAFYGSYVHMYGRSETSLSVSNLWSWNTPLWKTGQLG